MQSRGLGVAGGFLIVLVASSAAGAFLSRFLAENLYQHLSVFYQPAPTIILVAATTLVMIIPRILLSRRTAGRGIPLRDAASYFPFLLLALYVFQRDVDTIQAGVLLIGALLLYVSLEAMRYLEGRLLDRALLAIVLLLPLALYLKTLAPTVGEHDTFEFQVLSYELGIAHPTGYPLYIMLGKLFTFLPLGNVAYRVNLSSAVFAAVTVLVLYATIYYLTQRRSASALAALSFAFSYAFWSQATAAEVYALNALFVTAICYLLLRCFRQPSAASRRSQPTANRNIPFVQRPVSNVLNEKPLLFYAAAFTYGISLTHHRTMLLLAPALMIYTLLNGPRFLFRLRRLVLLLVAFVAPLLAIHLYLPLRWWQLHGQTMPWSQFAHLVLGTQFAAALQWDALFQGPDRLLMYLRILLEQYPAPALGLALLGFVWLFWPKKPVERYPSWKEGAFLLTAFTAYVLFGLSYHVPDVSVFVIPSHLIIAMGLGIGIASLCQLAEDALSRLNWQTQPARRRLIRSAALSLFGLLPMTLIWINLPRVDRSHDYAWYEWGRYALQQELPPEAVILADSEKIAPLHYLQRVEEVRPDTETGVFPDEQSNRAELERRLNEGKPVFLARFLPGLEGPYHLRSLGPLVEVSTSSLTELPPDLHLLKDTAFEIPHSANRVLLRGFRMDSADLRTTDPLHLTLYWQTYTDEPIRQNYEVRLRLISPQGHVWHQTRGRSPVNGLYPTTAWQPLEIVPDFHQLDLPISMPPGVYLLQVGLFPPFSQKGLTLPDVDEDYLPLAQVSVSPNAAWSPAIQHHSRMNFDSRIMLLGYDFPETVQPGGEAVLTLYWQRIGQVSIDYDLVLKLQGAGGDVLWQSVEPPFFGEYSTSRWAEGELIADAHDVPIHTAATGPLELTIGLRDPNSQRPLPVAGGWQAGQRDQSVLARIQTQDLPSSSEDENLPANFENRVSLLDYELHNVQVRRGDALELTLAWQGLAAMNEDYTVFVHLLDENEQIWGQQDTQPVYGTYPTSQWSAGEIIFDRHRLWTHERSPLGLYRVEIGLYLLRSMERLQVLDLHGNAISDRVLIEWVEIVP